MVRIRNKLSLWLIIPLLAITLFSVYSFAASVGVTSTTLQGENGVFYNVIGGFTPTSNGFSVVQASGVATPSPTWVSGGTAQTALTAGDWYYNVSLTSTALLTGSSHIITVSWNTGSGYSTLATITFTNSSTIPASQTMTFLFDTGGSSFNAPTGMTVTVS